MDTSRIALWELHESTHIFSILSSFSRDTQRLQSHQHEPCTISERDGNEIVGRPIQSPCYRMQRDVGPFPSPPPYESPKYIPVADGYNGEPFVRVEKYGRGVEALADHATLEETLPFQHLNTDDKAHTVGRPALKPEFDKKLSLAIATTRERGGSVNRQEEKEEKEPNSLAGTAGEIAAGILAAVTAAAAAAVTSVAFGLFTEAEAGMLSAFSVPNNDDAFEASVERPKPPPRVLTVESGVHEGVERARLRGAGETIYREGCPDRFADVGGGEVDLGVFVGNTDEAADVVHRNMQVTT